MALAEAEAGLSLAQAESENAQQEAARLRLLLDQNAASQQRYDLIILDAFSSDAIPVHLLTREAVAGYVSRLEPGGVLLLHISNRHMDLGLVVAAVGAAEGLVTWLKQDDRPGEQQSLDFKTNAIVAVLARSAGDVGNLPQRPGWREIKAEANVPAWTDDYSDILGAILRRKLAR